MSRTVLATDPGERVGWARATFEDDGTWHDLEHGITPLKDMALAIDKNIHKYDVLVFETWKLRPGTARAFIGSDFPSIQFIGMQRLSAWREGVILVPQDPVIKSTADKVAPPEIQEIIAREPGKHDDGHNIDALRHLFFYHWEEYIVKRT